MDVRSQLRIGTDTVFHGTSVCVSARSRFPRSRTLARPLQASLALYFVGRLGPLDPHCGCPPCITSRHSERARGCRNRVCFTHFSPFASPLLSIVRSKPIDAETLRETISRSSPTPDPTRRRVPLLFYSFSLYRDFSCATESPPSLPPASRWHQHRRSLPTHFPLLSTSSRLTTSLL